MKTTYDYTIKTVLEKVTIITVDAAEIEVPIVSNQFEPVLNATMTAEEKTAAKQEAKQAFKGKLMIVLGINEPKDYVFKDLWNDLYSNRSMITFKV